MKTVAKYKYQNIIYIYIYIEREKQRGIEHGLDHFLLSSFFLFFSFCLLAQDSNFSIQDKIISLTKWCLHEQEITEACRFEILRPCSRFKTILVSCFFVTFSLLFRYFFCNFCYF